MPTYNYLCDEHGPQPVTVDYEERDTPQHCPECAILCARTWMGAGPVVLQASYPDGSRRFDDIRVSEKLRRAKIAAKAAGDKGLEKEIAKDITKRNGG